MAKTCRKPRKNDSATDGLDPRLVELVRYLARRAAERDDGAFRKWHDQPDEPPAGRKEAT
jgi:hypothetical protein